MTAPLTLPPHLSSAEIDHRYRTCPDGVERIHWQIIWLLGLTEFWVRTIVHRYIDDGPEGLRDRRRTNPGATPLVSEAVRGELTTRLADPPADGGLWTGPKVVRWLTARLDRPISPQRAWEVLRAVGFTPQRPAAVRADPEAQAAFKKEGSPTP